MIDAATYPVIDWPKYRQLLLDDVDDPTDVDDLWFQLDTKQQHALVMWAYVYRDRIGRRALGRLLAHAWHNAEDEIKIRDGAWRTGSLHVVWRMPYGAIAELFERADPAVLMGDAFEAFKRLPATITVYRGCAGITIEHARLGMSWSTMKRVAREVAQSNQALGAPIILKAHVRKADILAGFFLDDPQRAELVVRSGAPQVVKVREVSDG
jgi:hypothetical protein